MIELIRAIRGQLLGIGHASLGEHDACDQKQAIGNGSEGAGVRLGRPSECCIAAATAGVVLGGDTRPVIDGRLLLGRLCCSFSNSALAVFRLWQQESAALVFLLSSDGFRSSGLYRERLRIADVRTAAGLLFSNPAIDGVAMPAICSRIATHCGYGPARVFRRPKLLS